MSMTVLQYLLGAGAGSLVGFSLGLKGGGGSILAVPLMIYLVGVQNPHVAIGTSAFKKRGRRHYPFENLPLGNLGRGTIQTDNASVPFLSLPVRLPGWPSERVDTRNRELVPLDQRRHCRLLPVARWACAHFFAWLFCSPLARCRPCFHRWFRCPP